MNKFRFKPYTLPIALLFISIIAYGLLIPWMGFYWDDWPFAWITHTFGPSEFIPAFLPFRPLLGPIFVATTTFLKENPLAWQVFALLLRCLTGVAVWWSFGKVWPTHKKEVALLSLCFVVFPGYLSQWVAFTHSNQELVSLLAYLLSFGVMVLAIRKPKRRLLYLFLSFVLMFVGLYTTEYFFGLELLRPVVLWFMFEELEPRKWARLVQILRIWAPYLVIWVLDGVFLYVYHGSAEYDSYTVQGLSVFQQPLRQFLTQGIQDVLMAIGTAGFAAWTQPFQLLTRSVDVPTNLLTLGLIVISFVLVGFYLWRLDVPQTGSVDQGTPWGLQAMLLGVIGILAGRLPSWMAGLPIGLTFSWDRFMLSMMLGGSFFLVGLVDFLLKDDRRKVVVVSLFVALAVGQQFVTANTFRRDWANQQQFFWQLSWRIPSLAPGTMLTTSELPLVYETDFSLTAPLNWIYSSTDTPHDLQYMLVYTKARLGSSILPSLEAGQATQMTYRTATFNGSTSDMVVFYYSTPGCVHILDPVYSNAETVPGQTYMLTDAIPLSNLSRIRTDSQTATLPAALFGSEPDHTWCYYFEKADLARQQGDWKQVAELGNEAAAQGYTAITPAEWLPFIEADARTGKLDDADKLTQLTYQGDAGLAPALCALWGRVNDDASVPAGTKERIPAIISGLNCAP
ncbi:MAG TPA: hypothetical protein VMC62_01505 [Longilinea sp.]|nr:hypothetical protein [Longilinea sp.]